MSVDSKAEPKTSNQDPDNDLAKRISIGAWHPRENMFAVAKYNSLFIYTEKRVSSSSHSKKKQE